MAITQITGLSVAYRQVVFDAIDITAGVVRVIKLAPDQIPPEFITQAQAVLEKDRLYQVKVYDVYAGALVWTNANKSEYSNDKSGLVQMIADMPVIHKYLPTPENTISIISWITPEAIGAMDDITPDFIDWVTDLIDDAVSDLGAKYRTAPILSRMLEQYVEKIGVLPPAPPVPPGRPLTPPITSEEIATNAVTPSKIPDGSLTAVKFAPGQLPAISRPITPPVENAEIADSAINSRTLAADAVITSKIAEKAVTTTRLGDAQVTPAKLSFTPVTRPLTPGVATDEIGDAQVTPAKLSFVPLRMATGTYTGDGEPTQAITGIGFQPRVVLIYPQVDGPALSPYWKTDRDNAFAGTPFYNYQYWAYREDMIISLDADGFTVGDEWEINSDDRVFTYIALG